MGHTRIVGDKTLHENDRGVSLWLGPRGKLMWLLQAQQGGITPEGVKAGSYE